MNLRIGTNLTLGLLATFMVVASLVFSTTLVGWLMLALAVVALVGVVQVGRSHAAVEQLVDAVTVVLGLWSLAASVAFAGATLKWLSFAEAVGFVVLALAGTTTAIALTLVRAQSEPRRASAQAVLAPLDKHPEGLGTVA
jgi:glucan phosphoethanolaminetransferase (alkaline phosphatase superfamily)